MTDRADPGGQPAPEHDHLTAEDVLEELVVEALEHADGGDGAPARRGGRAARLITLFGLLLGAAAVFFVVRRLVHDWPLIQPELHLSNRQVGLLGSVLGLSWALAGLGIGDPYLA